MKNLALLFTIALTSTALFSCENGKTSNTAINVADSTVTINTINTVYNGQIAFIRMDSLMNNYGMFIDFNDKFSKKSQKIQNELMKKARAIENEGKALEQKYQKGSLTRFQVESQMEALQKKQQNTLKYRDTKLAELSKEEAQMGQEISNAVKGYLEEYNEIKKYSMIIQTQAGSPVIIADPKLDITNDIIEELNKRYANELDKKSK